MSAPQRQRTYIRYLVEKPAKDVEFDFWSWEVIHWLVHEQPAEAWEVILDLVAAAPSDEVLDIIAASWIEDFIIGWGGDYIETIEAEAKRNPKFKQALSGVWIMKVSQDLFDRVEAAAGVPLRRA